MNKYTKLGELSVIQRTATGTDNSVILKVYVVKNVYTQNGDIRLMDIDDARYFDGYDGSEIVGYVEVFHPFIMWGSTDEIRSDIYRIVKNDMEFRGLITCNDYGTAFWVEKGQGEE